MTLPKKHNMYTSMYRVKTGTQKLHYIFTFLLYLNVIYQHIRRMGMGNIFKTE